MSFSDGGSFNNRVRTSPASQRGGGMDLSALMKVEDKGMATLEEELPASQDGHVPQRYI